MHETIIAQNLLTAISSEAKKQKARPISAKISCGKLYAINDELLCFAFQTIAKGTACEAMKLEIEHKPIQGQCKNCNQNFDLNLEALPSISHLRCPHCGSKEFDLLPDAPLILEQIEFQAE